MFKIILFLGICINLVYGFVFGVGHNEEKPIWQNVKQFEDKSLNKNLEVNYKETLKEYGVVKNKLSKIVLISYLL